MLKKIMNINVNYIFYDNDKKETIIFLHGWGQNISMMKRLAINFLDKYNLLLLDLPGFGNSDEPTYSWSIGDYALCLNTIIKDLNINNVNIIGHSFGGKIGLFYSSKYNVNKLVCLASPYCKELSKLPLKNRIYKFLKDKSYFKLLFNIIKKYIGSTDYRSASKVMKGVLVKSINIDMIDEIKKIKNKVLLIWGTNDRAVPIKRAYELNTLLANSELVIYDGTHYLYLEELDEVTHDIKLFLDEE